MNRFDEMEQKLVSGLCNIYDGNMEQVILYGSTARGTASPESDVDIAVIVHQDVPDQHDKMIDLVVDLELEYGKVLSVLVINEQDYQTWKDISPFYRNMTQDGIVLWNTALMI